MAYQTMAHQTMAFQTMTSPCRHLKHLIIQLTAGTPISYATKYHYQKVIS